MAELLVFPQEPHDKHDGAEDIHGRQLVDAGLLEELPDQNADIDGARFRHPSQMHTEVSDGDDTEMRVVATQGGARFLLTSSIPGSEHPGESGLDEDSRVIHIYPL